MPRARERLTLENGPVLDLAKIIPDGKGKPGAHVRRVWTYSSGAVISPTRIWLRAYESVT
jgi:hypothetical protein